MFICQALLCFQYTKKLIKWNLEKVYLVICGGLWLFSDGLWLFAGGLWLLAGGFYLLPILVTTEKKIDS